MMYKNAQLPDFVSEVGFFFSLHIVSEKPIYCLFSTNIFLKFCINITIKCLFQKMLDKTESKC